jgi:hypothetical protein
MNRSQLEGQERLLADRKAQLKRTVKGIGPNGNLDRAYADYKELQADEAALEAARASLDGSEALILRVSRITGWTIIPP